MTRYDVYGLGNALLDIECEVAPTVLEELGIDKGVMTLLDEASQNKILNHLGDIHTKRTCGGSGANTDRKSTRLNSSHRNTSRMPSSA